MNTHEPHIDHRPSRTDSPPASSVGAPPRAAVVGDVRELERQVEYILDDCFFSIGQAVGMRTTVDYDAVSWWRDRFRPKFLAALKAFGNRWLQDRSTVSAVVMMLGERAVRYSAGKPSIDCDAARQAAADVERYCQLHARRKAKALGLDASPEEPARIAGYWCNYDQ